MTTIALWICVCADDWAAESAIKTSNVPLSPSIDAESIGCKMFSKANPTIFVKLSLLFPIIDKIATLLGWHNPPSFPRQINSGSSNGTRDRWIINILGWEKKEIHRITFQEKYQEQSQLLVLTMSYPITRRIFTRFASKMLRSEIIANVSSSDIPFFNNRWANVLYLSLSLMWLILSCSFILSSSAAFSCCFLSSSACLLAASSRASFSLSASSFLAC